MRPLPLKHPLPLLGHLPWFWADTSGFLLRLARAQGDVATFRLGTRDAFLLSHPDHVHQVLVADAAAFRKGRLMQRARRLLGDGLLTSEGARHQAQRRRLQPAFCRRQLLAYGEVVPGLALRVTERWRDGQLVDIGAAMDELAMRVVAHTLLGVDPDRDAPGLAADLRLLARRAPVYALPCAASLERLGVPPFRAAGRAADRIHGVVRRWRRVPATATPRDFRAILDAMPPDLARDEAMTAFLAGHDTTGAALGWAWHLLAAHPHVADRLARELDHVLGRRDPTTADLAELSYTAMVFEETIRLYPPIGRIGRRPRADWYVDGRRIPAGAAVFLSPYVTARDPRWWPEPDRFEPERWTAAEVERRPRYAAFPFGAGPRSCIGGRMARTVAVLAIATIACRWRFRPAPDPTPPVRGLLTLKPRGVLRVRVDSKL